MHITQENGKNIINWEDSDFEHGNEILKRRDKAVEDGIISGSITEEHDLEVLQAIKAMQDAIPPIVPSEAIWVCCITILDVQKLLAKKIPLPPAIGKEFPNLI